MALGTLNRESDCPIFRVSIYVDQLRCGRNINGTVKDDGRDQALGIWEIQYRARIKGAPGTNLEDVECWRMPRPGARYTATGWNPFDPSCLFYN